ncbi:MAG: replication protein C [Acidiphilium sp. 37-64-53]|uniref:plasmid replication protein RepC n=1 Tax=Acidiphilium TaxID=522 RepID=UPI000BCD0685|nr:MAG: replication protein C [Acidiphilium sp. 37-64-53]
MRTVPTAGHEAEHTHHSISGSAAGLRRITPAMLPAEATAERFTGGDVTPGQALAALKSAAPRLGISPRMIHAIDWLFRFTQPQDWQPGARPIVWPSSSMQAAELGVTETQARRINRHLVELGLIVMRDSPNAKRYGRRDARGRIVEGYGFDLSPIGARLEEFRAVAEAYRAERATIARLRRRATIARNSLRQTWQTYHEQRIEDPALAGLRAAAEAASAGLRGVDAADALAVAVERLETIARTARQALEMALAHGSSAGSDSVEMSGRPDKNVRHITATTDNLNPTDTVMASDKCSSEQLRGTEQNSGGRTDRGSVMKIRPDELIRLAPRLKPYLRRASPSWPEIVDAADWLRHDLGISKPLWGDACVTMGREHAAIAVAIVSAKPIEYFRTTPGGYFSGMVAKARDGALHLDRTIWAVRVAK